MKKLAKWKFIIPIVLAIILIYIFVSFLTASFSMVYVESAQYQTVSKTLESDAYILRRESYITNDNGGVLYYNTKDFEEVAKNGVLATIYESESDAINATKLSNLDSEIANLKKLNSMTKVNGVSIESINKTMDNQLTAFIEDTRNNNFTDSAKAAKNLLYTLNEKQITTGVVSNFNEKLADLQSQRDTISASTKASTGQILSPLAGMYVSRTDGYESVYDVSKISKLTYNKLNELKQAKPQKVPGNAIGKIVTELNWYICCPMPAKDAKEFSDVDGLLKINIPYASADTLTASVVAVNNDKASGNAVVILECKNMNSTLAQIRQEKVEISVRDYSGIKIAKSAIHKDKVTKNIENADGTTSTKEKTVEGVYILYGNELRFTEISKLYETADYAICTTDDEDKKLFSSSTIKLYDKIVTEGTDLYAGKIVKQSTEVE